MSNSPANDLAQKWNTLASANRLLVAAVKGQDFGIIPSRKSLAMQAYRAFWDSPGADEYAKAATKAAR